MVHMSAASPSAIPFCQSLGYSQSGPQPPCGKEPVPASSINRAVAFYRHFVGIPTDQEPPAAR